MAERFKRLTVNQDYAGSSPVGYANMGCYTVSGSWAVCKTVVFDSGGSTPSHPTFICCIRLVVDSTGFVIQRRQLPRRFESYMQLQGGFGSNPIRLSALLCR